jgi:NAD+ kinase
VAGLSGLNVPLDRIALVVHPTRPVERALATLERWAAERDVDVIQLVVEGGRHPQVAAPSELASCDLVVALGGDGTVLSALRAAATQSDVPVLGIACGSLGALSAVPARELSGALARVWEGDWTRRVLPVLAIRADGAGDDWAVNDFVVVRRGAGQLIAELAVDDERYVRMAGDGVVVATVLGSSAYSMAAGGPVLAGGTDAFVCTPIGMHGGSGPPLVVPAGATVTVTAEPGFAGFDVEIDGHRRALEAHRFVLSLRERGATLATLGTADRGLEALRRRGVIADSPRVLARDARGDR